MELFLKEYLAHIKLEKNLSQNTVSSYKIDINAFISFLKDSGIDDPSDI
ncbi:MAG: site-specific tyrosine recombinase XerD, partial [Ignavibacteriales bacterium]